MLGRYRDDFFLVIVKYFCEEFDRFVGKLLYRFFSGDFFMLEGEYDRV